MGKLTTTILPPHNPVKDAHMRMLQDEWGDNYVPTILEAWRKEGLDNEPPAHDVYDSMQALFGELTHI